MKVLRAVDYRVMPWANGGGVTREVVVSPHGAAPADCDWRVSIATVSAPGPFSSLPKVDRALLLVDGGAMHVLIDGVECQADRERPLRFSGESSVECVALPDGPTTDLNLMTRRDRVDGDMHVVAADSTVTVAGHETVVLMPLDSAIVCEGVQLGALDCAVFPMNGMAVGLSVPLSGSGRVACLRVR